MHPKVHLIILNIVRLVCVLGLLVANIGASVIIPSAGVGRVSAPSGTTQRADAVVLVNSTSANYADFQRYVQPYLNHFGVPYSDLDIAPTPVGANLSGEVPLGEVIAQIEHGIRQAGIPPGVQVFFLAAMRRQWETCSTT